MVTTSDIVTYLAREENLFSSGAALNAPLSVLFPSLSQAVEHVHPRTSLCQALDIMLDGVQHLVVPITKRLKQRKPLKIPGALCGQDVPSGDYCWITQEDVLRYLLSSIGSFYPLPMMSLEDLGMINTDVMMVDANSPASRAIPLIQRASQEMTAVAVVTELGDGDRSKFPKRSRLVGDISTQTLRGCSETAAAALATLSVKEFLQYIHDAGGPSQDLADKIASRLKQRKAKLDDKKSSLAKRSSIPSISSGDEESDMSDGLSDYSSSDEDLLTGASLALPSVALFKMKPSQELPSVALIKLKPSQGFVPQHTRAKTLISCRPHSSLVAVMAQALAHRINHVWVTDAEGGLVGIVTYADMIDVLVSRLHLSN